MPNDSDPLLDANTTRYLQRMSTRLEQMWRSADAPERQSDWYRWGDDNLLGRLRQQSKENHEPLKEELSPLLRAIEEMLDLLYAYASLYLSNLDLPRFLGLNHPNCDPSLGVTAFHKSTLAIFAALTLVLASLPGAAGPLLRQAFEWLVIAKYYYVSGDEELFERWLNGASILIGREVLHHLQPKVKEPLGYFWQHLCKYTHASTSAQQISLDRGEVTTRARLNLLWIRMLIECSYHLLNSWMIPRSLKQFMDRVSSSAERSLQLKQKERFRALLRITREVLTPRARGTVYAFRLTWKPQ
jgi:hypothetical protein